MTCQKLGLNPKKFSDNFIAALMQYEWPGNIRELVNTIERAIILSQDTNILTIDHLRVMYPQNNLIFTKQTLDHSKNISEVKTLKQLEHQAILETLKITNHNYVLTAKLLGIHRNTLRNKLKEYQNLS